MRRRRNFDADGHEIAAEDVLDETELAEYRAHQRAEGNRR